MSHETGRGAGAAIEAWLRAHPEDWDSWRVYGDLLTEREDLRGELIQLEHRLATATLSLEEEDTVRDRIDTLREHRWMWLAGMVVPKGAELLWRFEFVVAVALGQGTWRPPATLAALERTARFLTKLNLVGNNIGAEGAAALARSPALRPLVILELRGNAIGDEGVLALARSETLGSLAWLGLAGNAVGDEGVLALTRSERSRALTELDLRDNGIGDEGALALARSEGLGSLTELDLRGNHIGDEGALALVRSIGAESGALRSLIRLNLEGNGISREVESACSEMWPVCRVHTTERPWNRSLDAR
jgi:uncharacterized protein (TIGR02996 family)